MSTDIAFSLGVLAFVAKRVPRSVIVFLTALAIVDDLGGIVVIALFYSTSIQWTALGAGLAVLMVMALFSWRNVHHPLPYVLGGVLTWYAFYQAGIHPTVAGVLTGFLIPAGTENTQHSHPLHLWEHKLSPWSAFLIMPIFALGNAGISMTSESFASLASPIGLGIIAGLFLGKPLGIFTTVFLMVKLGIAKKPERCEVDALLRSEHPGRYRLHDVHLPRLALLRRSCRAHLCKGSDRDSVHPLGTCRFIRIQDQ